MPATQTITLTATATNIGQYLYLPFPVPAGVNRIAVKVTKVGDAITGVGLFDQRGAGYQSAGKPPTTDFLGGGENIRAKDYMVLHQPPETFLAMMVLDGVFEAFPELRGGCIEQGAMWVVPWLKRLDIAQNTFKKTEPALDLPLRASEYVRRQLWFTPFPAEPVGWMVENAGDDLFLFSSDYPHPEGGRDPLKRFEDSLAGVDDAAKERFYSSNYADMMGGRLAIAG